MNTVVEQDVSYSIARKEAFKMITVTVALVRHCDSSDDEGVQVFRPEGKFNKTFVKMSTL
jgi:hypothetical protein